MANASSSRTKRAVAASRVVSDDDEVVAESNYGLRLTQALEAISAAEARSAESADYGEVTQRRFGRKSLQVEAEVEPEPKPEAKPAAKKRTAPKRRAPLPPATQDVVESVQLPNKLSLLQALDKLPPIRLPIGPAIPWRVGLPALIVLLVAMAFMYRPTTATEDRPGVRLPAQETYAVQSEAPLFASAKTEEEPQPAAQPIGIAEPSNAGMDALDIGLKLVAVLALAYGSLMLLKRFGSGGGLTLKSGNAPGVRVVTSLSLGQNRSVHVIKVNGGKTLLVGATPTQVNLIADLGEVNEDDVQVDAVSFFDVLSGKLGK